MKKLPWLVPFTLLTFGAAEAMAIETPNYEVLTAHDGWELRRYAPYLVAETEVRADFEEAGNRAFRILADYIFGNNRSSEEIGMTAPVKQQVAGERIGMTAPVKQQRRDGRYVIAFVMPSRYSRATLPEPVDSRISIREMPERLVAARTYSGTWSSESYREHEETLLQGMVDEELWPDGEPVWARFNSPFSLWFMRRNEVQVPVSPNSPALREAAAAGG